MWHDGNPAMGYFMLDDEKSYYTMTYKIEAAR
jgi:hypothetical protein